MSAMEAQPIPQPRAIRGRPSRKWRRYPAPDKPRKKSAPPARIGAELDLSATMARVSLRNGSSKPVKFFVEGVEPVCTIELLGNSKYTVDLLIKSDSSAVRVRRDDKEGSVLAEHLIEPE